MEESEVAADYKSLLTQAGIDKRAPRQAAERAPPSWACGSSQGAHRPFRQRSTTW